MATNVFNFDGTLLTTVADGTLDQTHASIKIPGRGYQNYGQPIVQDLLWVMQNFAGTTAPPYPSTGQLWYDMTAGAGVLRVWTGAEWVTAGGVVASDTAPQTGYNQGAFWYNTRDKQLNTWNGTTWDLVGPLGSKINEDPLDPSVPANSTVEAMTVIAEEDGLPRQIWRISIGGQLLAILSKDQAFTPQSGILSANGFQVIYPGLNFNNTIANIGLSGDSTVFKSTQSNLPASDALFDLGSTSRRFNTVYSSSGVFSNSLGINVIPSSYNFQVNGTSKFNSLVNLATGSTTTPPLKFPASSLLTTDPQLGAIEFDGNNFYFSGLVGGQVRRQQPVFSIASTASLTLYVSHTNGVDTNDGRSRGTPYRTIKRALDYLITNNLQGYTIFVESGEYLEENPMYVPPRTSIVGDNLRRVAVRPVHDHLDVFHVDVGTYFFGMTIKDHRSPSFSFAFPCSTATAAIETDPASPYFEKLTQILPTYSYTGYSASNPPDVFIEAPGYGAGTRATATANVVDGAIVRIVVDPAARGSGYDYTSPPIVTVVGAGGSGTGAVLSARIADRAIGDVAVGQLIGIDIIDPGQDYAEPLSISIAGGSTRASASGTVGNGVIRSFTITSAGSGYKRAPWVSIKPPYDKQAIITSSPYVQNCSSITGPFDTSGRLIPITYPLPWPTDGVTPIGPGYGPLDPNGAGSGIRIDGEVVNNDLAGGTVIRSFVADAFTQINQGGIGHLTINRGYAQFVSCFTTFSSTGYWARSGGFANISNSVIDFGNTGLKAEGYYPVAYTEGQLAQTYTSGVGTIKITDGGSGYVTAPSVTIKTVNLNGDTIWSGGVAATAECTIQDGAVVTVTMTDGYAPGSGYVGVPVIEFGAPPPGGTQATGEAVLAANPIVRISNTTSKPEVGSAMLYNGEFITVLAANNFDPADNSWDVSLQPALVSGNFAAGVNFHDISNLSTGGLALEYVGSGVTYNALPRYGGIPDSDKQVVDRNTDTTLTPGVVYYVTIANDGNFRVGPFFKVNFVDGTITLGEGASFEITNITGIGPFKRNGVTVGTRANEISANPTLMPTGFPAYDATTLPTQSAVKGYFGQVNSNILPKVTNTYKLGNNTYRWQEIVANVLTVSSSTVSTLNVTNLAASTMTAATVNAGDTIINGNLTVTGNQFIFNTNTYAISDSVIDVGTAIDNAPLVSDDGKDRGVMLHYFNTSASWDQQQGDNHAFMGLKRSTREFVFLTNVSPGQVNYPNPISLTGAKWGNVQAGGATFNGNVFVNGDFIATGDVIGFYSSDERLKTQIQPIGNALSKVESLDGVTFDWNTEARNSRPHRTRREAGVLAQQVERVLPEVVGTGIDGYKSVDYDKLVPLLIQAIKELSDKVKKLENR